MRARGWSQGQGWCVGGTVDNIRGRMGECSCGRNYVRVTAAGKAYRHKRSRLTRDEMNQMKALINQMKARKEEGR